MKRLLFILVTLAALNKVEAKIWRVNNNSGISADFTTAQAAHDGASAGDTIHLEPSVINYGNLQTSKRLVWVSTGGLLGVNPGVQASPTPGTVGQLIITTGSENSVFYINCNNSVYVGTNNIRLENCYIESGLTIGYSNTANNTSVIRCFLNYIVSFSSPSANCIIANNIISYYINMNSNSSAIITNNVLNFINASNGTAIYNSTFQNNIINTNATYSFTNTNINNNMSSNGGLPAGNGNIINVNMSTVFLNSTGNDDVSFQLKPGSPAIGAGISGVDMGAFGGASPYALGLQAPVPSIYKLLAPASVSGNTLNVIFSTKSNN